MRLITLLLCSIAAYGQGVIGGGVSSAGAPPAPQTPKPDAPTYKPEELCTVEGVVRNAVTGEPLKKANIALLKVDPRNPSFPATTSTNPEGKFALKAIEPGQYRLSVERAGFVRTEYGARPGGSWGGGATLTLAKGQKMSSIDFTLSPHSVITGRVLDEDGDPVQGAQIQLLRHRFYQGKKQLMPVSYSGTNDLGEYRMFGVAPGKYYLSVTSRSNNSYGGVDRSANPQPDEGYATTYYPGTPDIGGAAQINVALGRTIQGVDATLRKTKTFRVKGIVTGAPRAGNRGGMLNIRPKDAGEMSFGFDRNMSNFRGPSGEFEVRGIRPGSYIVEAMYADGPDQMMVGRTSIDVGDRDVENVTVSLGGGIEVRGNIRVDGQAQLSFAEMRVYLEPKVRGSMMGGNTVARSNEDGAFTVLRAMPDSYYVRVMGAPAEFYLKSVRLADIDVLEHGLDLEKSTSASGLDVVMSPGAATVDGSVADEKGNPIKGAVVLLKPKDAKPSMLSLLQKYVTSDQNGQFKIPSITPGSYSLLSFDGVDLMEAQDPDFFEQHASKAVTVELKENGVESRPLKAVSLEQKQQ